VFFEKFVFLSTLIISISIDMFVCWVVDPVEKKKISKHFLFKFVLPLSVFPSKSWVVEKKFGIFFFLSTLGISFDMFVCLLGSRFRGEKKVFEKNFFEKLFFSFYPYQYFRRYLG